MPTAIFQQSFRLLRQHALRAAFALGATLALAPAGPGRARDGARAGGQPGARRMQLGPAWSQQIQR
jgi:hypothetical protein